MQSGPCEILLHNIPQTFTVGTVYWIVRLVPANAGYDPVRFYYATFLMHFILLHSARFTYILSMDIFMEDICMHKNDDCILISKYTLKHTIFKYPSSSPTPHPTDTQTYCSLDRLIIIYCLKLHKQWLYINKLI
jgi:hypothetical protein